MQVTKKSFIRLSTLKEALLNTGNAVLAEASPKDKIWGIGLVEDDPNARNPEHWNGQNLLGDILMEIRGIGVIDIKAMYGIGAVAISKSIDLIIELETWDENKAYDRIGLQDDEIEIMGVRVPHQLMPIKPGRNLAIIVEVAARNLSVKRTGYNAPRELLSVLQDDTND